MRVYILRHAETDFNLQGIVQGSSVNTDINEKGQLQSKAFYEHYAHIPFELVITSALKRTHQTVHSFIKQGIPWHQTPDINEISWGMNEGKPTTPEWRAIWEEVRDHWNAGRLEARMPGGESARELNDRLLRFIDWLSQRQEKKILICTHGRAMRGLVTLLKGVTLADMEGVPHVNTGCYVAEFRGDRFHFEVENDVTHLSRFGLI